MKTTFRILVFTALLLQQMALSAQTLTNAQVYDFNVGDVILSNMRTYGIFGGGPPAYLTQTVLSKTYSVGNDTIYYMYQNETYVPAACPTCNPTYSLGNSSQAISNLSALAEHGNQTTCLSVADTFYSAFCNKQVWERHSVLDPGCFEPVTNSTYLIAGLGGPYFEKAEPMGPLFTDHKLLAYRKAQDSCGTLLSVVDMQNELAAKIHIFPNPAVNSIQFEGAQIYTSVAIFDNNGKLVISDKINGNSVDVSKLKSGTYLISFYGETQKVVCKQFQKL